MDLLGVKPSPREDERSNKEILTQVLKELDEIKRYVATTYQNTDNEVGEIRDLARRIERKLSEMDSQVDRIERFERDISTMATSIRNMERKMR